MENQCQPVALQPGDRIYIHSDGVVETISLQGELFDVERLQNCLVNMVKNKVAIDQLLQELNAFRGGAISVDDITVVEFSPPLIPLLGDRP